VARDQFLAEISSFNIGVELGQLGALAVAFGTVVWLRAQVCYRAYFALPLSGLIGFVGLVWFVQRTFGWTPTMSHNRTFSGILAGEFSLTARFGAP
jgi:hypothetical protein